MQVLARRLRDCWDSERFRGRCGGTWLIARLMCCWIGLDGRRRDGMDSTIESVDSRAFLGADYPFSIYGSSCYLLPLYLPTGDICHG